MSTDVLRDELLDGVRTLTLNRPEKRNALNAELVEALIQALDTASGDPNTRVVVLTGAGDRAFCSGADLDPIAAAAGPAAAHESRRRFVELMRAFRRSGPPIIARVAGHVAAGGMGLVAACDLVVAADDVHFATPEVNVGLFPMMIMAVLAQHIPRKRLAELMLTGERVSASDAAAMHLVNRVVPRDRLDDEVAALAAKLAGHSPAVLRLGRRAMVSTEGLPVDAALEALCAQLTLTTLTEDAAEGLMAFIERRPPQWCGR
ncbi:MAG: enoyl-CoA hydratase/isomerase family protein [Myxococcales bacterium]|nr:enoyl-CoA hydratase/isomerase family protein [Myxococcales bacterium]MCB9521161.1 enoyl-CoA hydratase/isomerase family protein [Myxococcales bacterium]MCB9530519.1 enoyl-CoA hydratase/isomerase family protein [Myxococcales bacterium]